MSRVSRDVELGFNFADVWFFTRGPPESCSGPPGIPFCSEVIRRRGWTPSATVENEFVGSFYHAKELIPEGFVWRCQT